MGNWTDRFDPETVDEIKRFEVGEGDFLLAERLAMHKGVESVFGFHVSERVSAKGTCAVRVDIGAGEGALREAGEGQIP